MYARPKKGTLGFQRQIGKISVQIEKSEQNQTNLASQKQLDPIGSSNSEENKDKKIEKKTGWETQFANLKRQRQYKDLSCHSYIML